MVVMLQLEAAPTWPPAWLRPSTPPSEMPSPLSSALLRSVQGLPMRQVVAVVLCAVCVGCAGLAHFGGRLASVEPVKVDGQDILYKNGIPIILSRAEGSDFAASPQAGPTGRYRVGARVFFMVSVRNLSSRRIEISEASFAAAGNDAPRGW
jgi:hypothetical protein